MQYLCFAPLREALCNQFCQRSFHIIRQVQIGAHGKQAFLHPATYALYFTLSYPSSVSFRSPANMSRTYTYAVLYVSFIAASPPGHRLHAKHGKRLVDLVHANSLFALLQFAHKAKPKSGANGKFLLREPCFFSFLFDKHSYRIHMAITHLIGYNVNVLCISYTR